MIPIFAHTQTSFVDAMFQVLGKGRQHIALFYEEIFRKGRPPKDHPAFANAGALLDEIIRQTDVSVLPLVGERSDGATGKFLLQTPEKLEVETVLIPMQSGGTLCISSQVGCRMGCAFCETGRMGLLRSLKTEEIISQVIVARHHFGFSFRNIVFMGMGEPFYNYEAVLQAARILLDPKGLGFGKKNITISTSGCVEGIRRFTLEPGEVPNLAVSLNAPEDIIRNRLMPINRKHDMAELHEAMQAYNFHTGRQILIAYVLLQGINDTLAHADRLAEYLRGLHVKVNLILYNPQSRDRFQPPDKETLEAFAQRLREHGYFTLLRVTKGREIMAACGQLGNISLKAKLVRKEPIVV